MQRPVFALKSDEGHIIQEIKSGVVAKGFLRIVFCLTMFYSVLCRLICAMFVDEHLNFKKEH